MKTYALLAPFSPSGKERVRLDALNAALGPDSHERGLEEGLMRSSLAPKKFGRHPSIIFLKNVDSGKLFLIFPPEFQV